ncbi:MAG: sulfatase-like hydrolase/transferase [Bacteroidales bacterium]|nr:sulfatase-like hydrolase/transferase [Bacteroidales bacterium]
MSDDHASKAISAYDTSLMHTPNIDRLAENGIRFDNCYCTNAICSPSRAVILTGKYSHMNGVIDNSLSFDGSQQTLPKILREAGYQTAMVGKWHLKSEPTGFDYWLVLPGQGQYYRPDFIGPEGRISVEGYVTDIITDKGIEFIESRDTGKPFFMMLHHKAPHRSWQPAIRHLDKYKNKQFPVPENLQDRHKGKSAAAREQEMSIARHMALDHDLKMPEELLKRKGSDRELFFGTNWNNPRNRMAGEDFEKWAAYYTDRADEYNALPNDSVAIDEWKYRKYMEDYLSCIYTMDENIGRLIDHLEETGLNENTIVIYTSDQGFFLGEHGWYDKRFMYDEAHRMPLIISAHGLNKGEDDHMIINADFAPTILNMAGIEPPPDMQGESFYEILQGGEPGQWRESVYYHYFEYPAVHSVKRHYGVRTNKYKLIHYYYDIDEWELFDLEDDPYEMNNLAGNPDFSAVLSEMKTELNRLRVHYQDTVPEKYLPPLPDTISHLAKGISYTLEYQPSERYAGNPACLTDGIVYPEGESYSMTYEGWCGFNGDDLILELDLGQVLKVSKISAGFLQNQERWIFLPDSMEFHTSEDGVDYMIIPVAQCGDQTEDHRILKRVATPEYPGISTRYIKIHVMNNVLPAWHRNAGKPAWLFVDEIVVSGK